MPLQQRQPARCLVQALLDGVPGSRVKDRMAALEARKAELEADLAEAVEEPVLLHPNMAQVCERAHPAGTEPGGDARLGKLRKGGRVR